MLLSQLPRSTKAGILVALTLTCLLFLHLVGTFPAIPPKWRVSQQQQHHQPQQADVGHAGATSAGISAVSHAHKMASPDTAPCQLLQGGENVLVVMRTGATEIGNKLPAHLDTTLPCYKNLVIFSDYAEEFHGHKVHDVLADIEDEIKTTNADFTLYQHVLEVGRKGLNESELAKSSYDSGPVGKVDNAGWRLDKWKFLPMINATWSMYPNMDWYVFVEPDTYLVWSNFLQWIGKLDPSQSLYFGSEVQIGGDVFAHGGSAFTLSRPALKKGAESYRSRKTEWHQYTAKHWAGDCVLGKALHDNGVELTWTWPMFQGGNPSLMTWHESKPERKLWCLPALSYHHLNPDEVRKLFNFEQNWIREKHLRTADRSFFGDSRDSPILHHRDVFNEYVLPNITAPRADWNNTALDHLSKPGNVTFRDCQAHCEADPNCLQYASDSQDCYTSDQFRLGRSEAGSESGWMVDRVKEWMKTIDHCTAHQGWSVP